MGNKKRWLLLALLALMLLLLSGCAPGDGANTQDDPAGFFTGVWHGWIAPVTLVVSLFNRDIGIYEVHNTGFWYDLGYYMAVISGFGGLALSRKKGKREGGPGREG